MTVRLYQLDTVVVGRFNPYIITPEWVKKEGIAQPDTAEFLFGVAGRDIAFQFKTGKLSWQVDYSRLTITTDDPAEDTAAKFVEVIEKLPHTPLTALGNNFHYQADAFRWSAGLPSLGKKWDFKTLSSQGKIREVKWGFGVEKEEGLVLGVTLEQTEKTFKVHVNFHRPVTDKEQAVAAAKRFSEDLEASRELLREVIGEQVEQ